MSLNVDKFKIAPLLALILLVSYTSTAYSYISPSRMASKLVRESHILRAANIDPLLSTQENAMINLFERVRPSVVYVSTFLQAFNPLLMNVMEVPSQTGSGCIMI